MSTDSGRGAAASKGTLFCPACSHSARYDGDWDREPAGRGVRLVCPACGTEVTHRGTAGADDGVSRRSPMGVTRLWQRQVRIWQTLWWRAGGR